MKPAALLLGTMLLVAAAPVPPETPPEKQEEAAPMPPDKPEVEANDQGNAVPLPAEKPADAMESGSGQSREAPLRPDARDLEDDEQEAKPAEPAELQDEEARDDNREADDEPVPLPRETPSEVEDAQERAETVKARPFADTTEPIEEAACRIRLAKLPAEWEVQDPLREQRCGIGRGVLLTEVAGLELRPAATVNCRTAEALTLWVRDDVVPAAEKLLDEDPTRLLIAGSYVCRNRNGAANGKISEHAFGNAVDVAGFAFEKETVPVGALDPKDSPARSAFQKEIRKAACERFTTVLGPGANASHSTHFHLDLRARRGGYRLCE